MSMLVVFFFSWLPLNTINLAEDLGKAQHNHRHLTILTAFCGFFLLYTDRVPFELLDRRKGALRWMGANSISKFDHHNINGGDVNNT
jgi:hypothetical protein